MTRIVAVALLLAACQAQPRSAAFFESNPDEAQRVVKACKAGSHRGRECENAQTGLAAVQANKRLDLFKKSFE